MANSKKYYCTLALSVLATLTLQGCGGSGNTPPSTPVKSFATTAVKAKSTMIDSTSDKVCTLEVYVDADGDGKGLLGYKGKTYRVYIVSDYLYVQLGEENVIRLTDMTGHLYISGESDPLQYDNSNFLIEGGEVKSFSGTKDTMIIESQYSTITNDFDTTSVAESNQATLASVLSTIDLISKDNGIGDAPKDKVEQTKSSFWTDSPVGIKISNKRYSCGDYCDPYTYFKGQVPESITYKTVDNQGSNLELTYVSYLSPEGRTVFTLVGGYVYSIYTNCPFTFCNLKYGVHNDDLRAQLGVDLNEEDAATFKPVYKGLEVDETTDADYTLLVSGLKADLTMSNSNTLYSIYLKKPMPFEVYNNESY